MGRYESPVDLGAAESVAAPGLFPGVYFKSGQYAAQPGTITAWNMAAAVGFMRAHHLFIPRALTLDRIGLEVTAAVATAVVRLGIWNTDSDGRPTTLVLDAGTIDGNSATLQLITISQALAAGCYVLSAVAQTAGPTVRATTPTSSYLSAESTAGLSGNAHGGFETSGGGTTGALPGTFPAMAGGATPQPPRILVRAV